MVRTSGGWEFERQADGSVAIVTRNERYTLTPADRDSLYAELAGADVDVYLVPGGTSVIVEDELTEHELDEADAATNLVDVEADAATNLVDVEVEP